MIFVANADGGVSYVSPEWSAFTGQAAAEAVEHGWSRCLHADDFAGATSFLQTALDQQSEYTLNARLRRTDGSYTWVVIGAVPSYGPPARTFLGFLGSITEVAHDTTTPPTVRGTLARFVPPPMNPATPPGSVLEAVADHLLMAHGLIEEDGAKELLPTLRQALAVAGRLLARGMTADVPSDRIH
ncbi:PAS domain-containing protein [Methylobacterium sp. A49B]